MRGILALVVVVLILALVGWITFGNNANEATISIDKQKVKQDVDRIKQSGAELGDKLESQVEEEQPAN